MPAISTGGSWRDAITLWRISPNAASRIRSVIERMRIGYAPGACLRGYLARLGYSRQELIARGLVDERGRDCFFRRLTFPLTEADSLYGRSIANGLCRHRFLPGSKGDLYGWARAAAFGRVIVVEGLFDLAA